MNQEVLLQERRAHRDSGYDKKSFAPGTALLQVKERFLVKNRAGDGAPAALFQNLTGSERQDKNGMFISSSHSCGQPGSQAGYAISE
jgi:hypothetical protein